MRSLLIAIAAVLLLASPASARQRSVAVSPECNVTMPCDFSYLPVARTARVRAATPAVRETRRVVPRSSRAVAAAPVAARVTEVPSASGLVAPLAAKVAEIEAACGSRVISGVRHTYIAGTRRISLHASGQAADVAGNPGCIYGHLSGWAGGYSTDYASVAHVHISWGGPEHGIRFVHGGGRHHHRRYAAR